MALEHSAVVGMLFEEERVVVVGVGPNDLAVTVHSEIVAMV